MAEFLQPRGKLEERAGTTRATLETSNARRNPSGPRDFLPRCCGVGFHCICCFNCFCLFKPPRLREIAESKGGTGLGQEMSAGGAAELKEKVQEWL